MEQEIIHDNMQSILVVINFPAIDDLIPYKF